MPAELIHHALQHILEHRRDVLLLAARQRSKFEHWLKFELAARLAQTPALIDVRLECAYVGTSINVRSDVAFTANGER